MPWRKLGEQDVFLYGLIASIQRHTLQQLAHVVFPEQCTTQVRSSEPQVKFWASRP